MDIEFDPVKDAVNLAKHGISLIRAPELDVIVRIVDIRFTEERRFALMVVWAAKSSVSPIR